MRLLRLSLVCSRIGRWSVVSCAALSLAASAFAQSPDLHNAATWYQRAITAWQQFKQTSPEQAGMLTDFDGSQPITPELRSALMGVQGVFDSMRRGSMQESCDFNLDYSQGFELLLPHLGEMRGIVRAMRADATVRLSDGDTSGAAGELASMYRTSGHCGDDRVLISGLVGQSIFGVTDGIVQSGLDKASFNAADAATLLAGTKTLTAEDPFQYLNAIGMEQEIALTTLEKYRGPDGIQKLGELLGEGDRVKEIGNYTDQQFDQALGQYDAMMGKVSEIFSITNKDDAMKAMGDLEKDIEGGKYGALATVMAPAFGKVLDRKFAGQQMLSDRVKVLSDLASGAQKPEEAANAALWYLHAIELWEALPKEKRQPLLGFEPDVSHDMPAPVAAALVDVQPILDVMRDAAAKRRCDFAAFVHHRGLPAVAPHYAPGMHELLGVLRADAVRLLKAGDKDGATDRLSIDLRAAAHLGNDVNLACCRVAHVNFNLALDVIEAAQKAKLFDAQSSSALADAASRISRKDPFGYLEALLKSREPFIRQRFAQPPSDEAGLKEWARQTDIIKQLNGDQLMIVLIVADERMRRMIASPPPAASGAPAFEPDDITLPEAIERLNGVFDAKAVDAVRARFDDIMPRLLQDDCEIFQGQQFPPIARLAEGLGRARGDLRRATKLLMLPEESEKPDKPQP